MSAVSNPIPAEHQDAPVADDGRLTVVCLSPQPWTIALPTNRQQVMRRVAERGHRVLYVETGPFVSRHLRRALRGPDRASERRQLLGTEQVLPGVRVMKAPNPLPWGHRLGLPARINARLAAWVIRRRLGRTDEPVILWLYDPCFAAAVGRVGERFAVYDCVDDYAEQTGDDARKRAFVSECDAATAERARLVFATATPLVERHSRRNGRTHLVRNVGDFAHFASAADPSTTAPELAGLSRPVVGFAGNFLAEKVDFELLAEVAERRPDWTLLLLGPTHPDTESRLAELATRPNVRRVDGKPYAELPSYIAAFDVGVIPYRRNAYTASCFPLKTFEYLAAGKPVVASGLPELRGFEPHVLLAEDAASFVEAVEAALARTAPEDVEARQAVAAANTWETRTERLLELVTSELRA
jgi:glycosyltransferase involved in cell wall biosynthesis